MAVNLWELDEDYEVLVSDDIHTAVRRQEWTKAENVMPIRMNSAEWLRLYLKRMKRDTKAGIAKIVRVHLKRGAARFLHEYGNEIVKIKGLHERLEESEDFWIRKYLESSIGNSDLQSITVRVTEELEGLINDIAVYLRLTKAFTAYLLFAYEAGQYEERIRHSEYLKLKGTAYMLGDRVKCEMKFLESL